MAGIVCKTAETRYSPAGVPVSRFTLEHRSRQLEAGMERETYCRVIVIATGDELTKSAARLHLGQAVKVTGFVARADNRQGQSRLILHAQRIDIEKQNLI